MVIKKDKVGETIPMYEEVKRNIYKLFEEMKNASSLCFTSKRLSMFNINHDIFAEKFITFYLEIKHKNKIGKSEKEKEEYINYAYNHLLKRKRLNTKQINKVMLYSRELMEMMGITKIEGRIIDPSNALIDARY